MFFSPRISAKPLAFLCRRLATALTAGIDMRTVWAREAKHAQGRAARRHLAAISRAINAGESLTAALAATDDFFPPSSVRWPKWESTRATRARSLPN